MTLEEFKRDYYCIFNISDSADDQHLEITSTAKNRLNDSVVDTVKTTIDISKTNDWIRNSQSPISLNTWNWQMVIEKTKRAQLDYFAMRAPIDNFYPLNHNLFPNIEDLYSK